jgi:hypothetical protein
MDFLKRTSIETALAYYGIDGVANTVLTEAIMSGVTDEARDVVQSDERIEGIVRNVGRSSAYLAGDYYLTPEEKNALIAISALGGAGGTLAIQRIARTRAGRLILSRAKDASKKLSGGSIRAFANTTKLLASTGVNVIRRPFSTKKVTDKKSTRKTKSTKETIERRKNLKKQIGKVTARGPGETAKDLGIGSIKKSKKPYFISKTVTKAKSGIYKVTPGVIYDPTYRLYRKITPKVKAIVGAPGKALKYTAKKVSRKSFFGTNGPLIKRRKPRMSISKKGRKGVSQKRRKPRMGVRTKRTARFGEDKTWFQKSGDWVENAGKKGGEFISETGGKLHQTVAQVPGYVFSTSYKDKDGNEVTKYQGIDTRTWMRGVSWDNMSEKQAKQFEMEYPGCDADNLIGKCETDAKFWFDEQRDKGLLGTKYPWKFWAADEGGLTGDIMRLGGYSAHNIYHGAAENPLGKAALAGAAYGLGTAIGGEKTAKAIKAIGRGAKSAAKGVGGAAVTTAKLGTLGTVGGIKLAGGVAIGGLQKAGTAIKTGTGVLTGKKTTAEALEEIIRGPEYTMEKRLEAQEELAKLRKEEIKALSDAKIKELEAAAAGKPPSSREKKRLLKEQEKALREKNKLLAQERAIREQRRSLGLPVDRPDVKKITGFYKPEKIIGLWPEESERILKSIPKKSRKFITKAAERARRRF